jgi:hypothetical protein
MNSRMWHWPVWVFSAFALGGFLGVAITAAGEWLRVQLVVMGW